MALLSRVQQGFGRREPELQPLAPGLDAAARWIARAQDHGSDDGVAAFYHVRERRWAGSYPETTGYIIPTLYDYAARTASNEFFDRATRMAVWESDIQLDCGGVRAGNLDAPEIVPTIFNTGQVLFGWGRAYQETSQARFADSLRRACEWLVAAQDDDGAWRRFASPHTESVLNTYNTRVAYGLAFAADILSEPRYMNAARANVAWAMTQVRANGWLDNNDLDDNERPLTHTIAYATRGILEIGAADNDKALVTQAATIAAAVAATFRADGALPGRLDCNWRAAASWSCLTGNAQMAIVWLRLAGLTGKPCWRGHARRAIAFVQATQSLYHCNPDCRGAIAGSAPLRGHYLRYSYPNWAAKFYMDAVMRFEDTTR